MFAATKVLFVETNFLSRQAYFCHDKHVFFSRQKYACRDKSFVATKQYLWQLPPMILGVLSSFQTKFRRFSTLQLASSCKFLRQTTLHLILALCWPGLFSDLLKIYMPSGQLRSSADSRTLCIPPVSAKSHGNRSFSDIAPTHWKTLPKQIRFSHSQSASSFKSAPKTPFPIMILIGVLVCVCECVCVREREGGRERECLLRQICPYILYTIKC